MGLGPGFLTEKKKSGLYAYSFCFYEKIDIRRFKRPPFFFSENSYYTPYVYKFDRGGLKRPRNFQKVPSSLNPLGKSGFPKKMEKISKNFRTPQIRLLAQCLPPKRCRKTPPKWTSSPGRVENIIKKWKSPFLLLVSLSRTPQKRPKMGSR